MKKRKRKGLRLFKLSADSQWKVGLRQELNEALKLLREIRDALTRGKQ